MTNVDVVTVSKIDQEAKRKGMSRNQLLKICVEQFALVDMHNTERNLYKESFDMNIRMLNAFRETQKELLIRVGNIEKALIKLIELDSEDREGAN